MPDEMTAPGEPARDGVTAGVPRGPQFPSGHGHDFNMLRLQTSVLVSEEFQFARQSYGDELTLHFGPIRLSKSAKLQDRRYGSYILRLRASPWIYKDIDLPRFVRDGVEYWLAPTEAGGDDKGTELFTESRMGHFIPEGVRVQNAEPFVWDRSRVIGIQLVFSNGSVFSIVPRGEPAPEDDPAPPLSDWELLSPHGLLKVGPNLKWEAMPRTAAA